MRRLIGRAAVLLSLASFVLAVMLAPLHQVAHHDPVPSECALCVVVSERPALAPAAVDLDAPVVTVLSLATPPALSHHAGTPARIASRGPPAPAFVSA